MHAFACKTDVLHITTSYAEIFPLRRHDSAGISFNSGDTMFRRVASHCATYYWDPRSKRSLRLEKFAKYLRRKLFIEHKRTRKHPPISSLKTQPRKKTWTIRTDHVSSTYRRMQTDILRLCSPFQAFGNRCSRFGFPSHDLLNDCRVDVIRNLVRKKNLNCHAAYVK